MRTKPCQQGQPSPCHPPPPTLHPLQPRPVVMMRACNVGGPRSDYLLAVYCTCIYLAGGSHTHGCMLTPLS